MIDVLGHDSALLRLYWAGDNLGEKGVMVGWGDYLHIIWKCIVLLLYLGYICEYSAIYSCIYLYN